MEPVTVAGEVAATGRLGLPRARFATALAILLALLAWIVGRGAGYNSAFLLQITVAAVLGTSIVGATDGARRRWAAVFFWVLAVVLNVLWDTGSFPSRLAIGPVAGVLFAAYATLRSLGAVLRARQVTGDVLAGALATYVMAGLTFAIVYGVVAADVPGAFRVGSGLATFPDLVYFSFITLLTVGFGDVTPAVPLARAVAVFEGLFGVVYTTVVMAALVAAYLEGRRSA